jgi:hypothetical protein
MLCAISKDCNFYSDKMTQTNQEDLVEIDTFCTNAFTKCSRYMVSMVLGTEFVPLDMHPKHKKRAKEMIGGAEVF